MGGNIYGGILFNVKTQIVFTYIQWGVKFLTQLLLVQCVVSICPLALYGGAVCFDSSMICWLPIGYFFADGGRCFIVFEILSDAFNTQSWSTML